MFLLLKPWRLCGALGTDYVTQCNLSLDLITSASTDSSHRSEKPGSVSDPVVPSLGIYGLGVLSQSSVMGSQCKC